MVNGRTDQMDHDSAVRFCAVGVSGEEVTACVAAQLAALRAQRGLSLAEIADLAGLHPSTVNLIERGKRGITIATAVRLADALDVRLSTLVATAEDATR